MAVKLNSAYFEAFGSAGWAALERCERRSRAGPLVILDAKRGDIGPSAERYAEALLGRLAADAVTLQPYLGEDAIEPFLAYPGRLVYVLARTSNPSAGRLQDLRPTASRSRSRSRAGWRSDGPMAGSASWSGPPIPRSSAASGPRCPPGFLVPGVGAQGGDLGGRGRAVRRVRGPGAGQRLAGHRRGGNGPDWRAAAAEAARQWLDDLRRAGATLGATELRRVGRKMPTIGAPELIIVLVIVLILFGPGRLPDIGNAIGKGIREFRKASSEIEDSIRGEPKSLRHHHAEELTARLATPRRA